MTVLIQGTLPDKNIKYTIGLNDDKLFWCLDLDPYSSQFYFIISSPLLVTFCSNNFKEFFKVQFHRKKWYPANFVLTFSRFMVASNISIIVFVFFNYCFFVVFVPKLKLVAIFAQARPVIPNFLRSGNNYVLSVR